MLFLYFILLTRYATKLTIQINRNKYILKIPTLKNLIKIIIMLNLFITV